MNKRITTVTTERTGVACRVGQEHQEETDPLEVVRGDIPESVYRRLRGWRSSGRDNGGMGQCTLAPNQRGGAECTVPRTHDNQTTTASLVEGGEDGEELARIHRACASMELHGDFDLTRDV
jgi:hypothetical protein